jgi:hypothetical protein
MTRSNSTIGSPSEKAQRSPARLQLSRKNRSASELAPWLPTRSDIGTAPPNGERPVV